METTIERKADHIHQHSHTSLYQALDFFMLRTPVFPIDHFIELSSVGTKEVIDIESAINEVKEYLIDAIHDPVFREAIAVASLPLYKSLDKLYNGSPKKSKQVFYSILSYYIRMSVRPTPFGLFSGVAIGTYKESTEITLNKQWMKKSRVDMQWLFNVIKLLEQDSMLLSNLFVHKNNLLYKHGDMMVLPYLSNHGVKEDSAIDNATFRITPVLEDVLAFAHSPIVFKDLIHKLQSKYQEVPSDIIASYLYNMVDKEFLITELRPPLLGTSPCEYVLQKVKLRHPNLDQNQLYHQLSNVQQAISYYNDSQLGEGEELYIRLTEKMMDVVKTKYALQVDVKIGVEEAQLKESIKQDIERAADILYRISSKPRGSDHMREYHQNFVEAYGYYNEIPVLELLDNSLGIGAPPTYANPPSLMKINLDNKNPARDFLLFSWVTDCLASGETTLQLTDQMIEELEIKTDYMDAPDSFDIYFTISAASQEAIGRNEYTLVIGPNGGSFGAGKTFGRFANMLGNEAIENLKHVHRLEQELNPDAIFAEVSYLPSSSRVVNVMLTPSIREYEIPIGTNSSKDVAHTLDLSDLVIGASSDRLYLKSKSFGKEIIPVTDHMVNHMYGVPNIYRFLIDLGFERHRLFEPFNWGGADQLPFLPRINYKNTVLFPATWRFNKSSSLFREVCNESDWERVLEKWRETYKVPRYINLTDYDNRILLDLDNRVHQQFIFQKFSKLKDENFLIFTELGFPLDENWVVSRGRETGFFLMEGVFPVVKRSHYQGKDLRRRLALPNTKREYIPKITRYKHVGSDWLYLKLYGPSDRVDELIYTQIRKLCHIVHDKGMVQKSFFMRYADPHPHVRLRFGGDPKTLVSKLIPLIHDWIKSITELGLVDEVKMDCYNPEIERYGGLDFIGLAEELFSFDSVVASELIAWRELDGKDFNQNLLAVISVVHILENSGLSMEKKLEWLNRVVSGKKQPQEFRDHKKLFMHYCDKNNWNNLDNTTELSTLRAILSIRETAIRKYFHKVYNADISTLTNYPDDILGSVIHLHLNRLGIHYKDEEQIMKLSKFTIQSLNFSKKK